LATRFAKMVCKIVILPTNIVIAINNSKRTKPFALRILDVGMIALVFYRIEWAQILPRIQLYLGTPQNQALQILLLYYPTN
jgi:hypothetical protein